MGTIKHVSRMSGILFIVIKNLNDDVSVVYFNSLLFFLTDCPSYPSVSAVVKYF